MEYIIKFINYSEVQNKEDIGIGGLGGFFEDGMRWKDYLEIFTDEGKILVEHLRDKIIENNIRCTGYEHQNSAYNSVPLFSNGKVATYSFRAWGDLMAAVWSENDNKDYNYMTFYM